MPDGRPDEPWHVTTSSADREVWMVRRRRGKYEHHKVGEARSEREFARLMRRAERLCARRTSVEKLMEEASGV